MIYADLVTLRYTFRTKVIGERKYACCTKLCAVFIANNNCPACNFLNKKEIAWLSEHSCTRELSLNIDFLYIQLFLHIYFWELWLCKVMHTQYIINKVVWISFNIGEVQKVMKRKSNAKISAKLCSRGKFSRDYFFV